jgi:very-short-patch-repair endonuclease
MHHSVTTLNIQRARALRRAATPPERQLWQFLRTLRKENYHFRRQAPFRGYVLDFVCYGRKLVIEVDGAQHGLAAQMRHDRARDAALAGEGFHTLRIQAVDVMQNLEGVSIYVREALVAPTPTPCTIP